MSPRQDTYLSLCLEQASKSPLHYRHGCIIVRGGKVIGRGFNHYRPGFNGGALKNGRSKTASDMLVQQKPQQKPKQKNKFNRRDEDLHACGGRADAHMALSMHAEMMAIRSALSLSSHPSGASARSNAWYETPCFRSPGLESARQQRRLEGRSSPVASQHRKTCGVLNPIYVDSSKLNNNAPNQPGHNPTTDQKTNEKKTNEKKNPSTAPRQYEVGQYLYEDHIQEENPVRLAKSKQRRCTPGGAPHQDQGPMLVPAAKTLPKARKLPQRLDSRLNGADLYVVRQAWQHRSMKRNSQPELKQDDALSSIRSDLSETLSAPCSPKGPLSLHDELKCSAPPPPKLALQEGSQCEPQFSATSSRPCYRCILYMEWAGIRRVFWTNEDEYWEGGKVRDLVDALGLNQASNGASEDTSAGIFITKHEILMMRRQMGDHQGQKGR
ncbi:hypothetical protein EPUS_08350 [Endocarpon pusillum Z07020]|uniref:CMP/dCMP-type deaminase domain-containing protein n=1 Tax=Endocarpon pusillum (strain Z07020 / HMAS-L-300199) TaxID=1263415 RepID=U1G0Q0_ENDPU|nr:uncharacterized protein EPUS_08350 [Endocarpon pusillum Z07020]ERF70792.1 hypothetical protein EPUS_08350 [Endocarpon pusillum Z07020]